MFDQTQSNILDGLMLGDAYVSQSQRLLHFSQRRQNREYVEFIARSLGFDAERVRDRTRKPDTRTGKIYECSELRTLSHPLFSQVRERWYKDGKKVVPGDLRISSACVLHWFLCDGSCSINRGGAQLVLCTDSFSHEDVNFLRDQLGSEGIETAFLPSCRRIRVSQKSVGRFYEYIGECPVSCLAYKWIPEVNRASRQQNLKPHYEAIHNLYVINGWSCERIARKFGTNYFSVRYILKHHYGIRFGKNAAAETTCREGVVAPSETTRRASPTGE